MAKNFDSYVRLEPYPNDLSSEAGFAAAVHDPCWFLARQWQMGEHQGENASSPVLARYVLTQSPIHAPDAGSDPRTQPAEAIVESEVGDWWTMGRRIRAGKRLSGLPVLQGRAELQFGDPPPPYEHFVGQFDGRAIWYARVGLGIMDAAFGPDAPPVESQPDWDSQGLIYQQDALRAFFTRDHALRVNQHTGGQMDWYSVDASANPAPDADAPVTRESDVIPVALQYPGAPSTRWWQIEDGEVDFGGYPPDSAHVPTAMLTDLIFSHSDDWFLFPVTAMAGHVVAMDELTVSDAFDRRYGSADAQWQKGLRPPQGWTLFKTAGLPDEALVLWHTAELPLESNVVERVQFGMDEQANLLWAVERALDSRETSFEAKPDAANPRLNSGRPSGDATKPREYVYMPSEGVVPRWHPYDIDDDAPQRVFVQRGLADLSRQTPVPMPPPQAEVLFAGEPGNRTLHRIAPSAIPSNGIEIERRWMLARAMGGEPVLWMQRQRKPLRTPPARRLRFDVMEEKRTE
jgi:hypothetical protein